MQNEVVYSMLMLKYPCAGDYELSGHLERSLEKIRKVIPFNPIIQRVPGGFFCEELSDYLGRVDLVCENKKQKTDILVRSILKSALEEDVANVFHLWEYF